MIISSPLHHHIVYTSATGAKSHQMPYSQQSSRPPQRPYSHHIAIRPPQHPYSHHIATRPPQHLYSHHTATRPPQRPYSHHIATPPPQNREKSHTTIKCSVGCWKFQFSIFNAERLSYDLGTANLTPTATTPAGVLSSRKIPRILRTFPPREVGVSITPHF